MRKLQPNNLIAQSNKLIEGRYNATKNELLLLVAMISLINPKDKEFLTFSVSVKELAKILDLDEKSSLREFKKISRKISKKTLEIETDKGWKIFPWVSLCSLEDHQVTVIFNDRLKPYLLDLKKNGNFTQYRLAMTAQFRSNYSIRMYQLLREYHSKKIYTFEFDVPNFRQMILGSKAHIYPEFKEFRKFVLNKTQKEFSQKDKQTGLFKSDLNFDLKTRRTGRKISHLIFTIKNQQTKPAPKPKKTPVANDNAPQIILDYETFGVMRKMVQPYLDQRGEQALRNTLNKFHQDKQAGKITKSEQGYLAYLLRVNAGQETLQDKERQLKEEDKQRKKEKEAKEQALKAAFLKERDAKLQEFFDSLQEGEIEYMLPDFEASEIFATKIKTWLVVHHLYQQQGIKGDPALQDCFNEFIIDRYLDETLNDFTAWKKGKKSFHH